MPVMENKRKADDMALVATKRSRNEVAVTNAKDKALIATVNITKHNLKIFLKTYFF